MIPTELEERKLRLEEQQLELEKARVQLEQSFSKRYATPLIAVLGTILAGVFALAQVKMASIQKDREIAAVQFQKDNEMELARAERERQWRFSVVDFVFKNRDAIFSHGNEAEQERIIKVIAVTFPPDITEVLFNNLKAAFPEQQKSVVADAQLLVSNLPVAREYAHATGSFKKKGDTWIEYPEYAPGKNFTFKELRRASDYLYLFDESRTKDGHPMYVRFPINGGVAQWSYSKPIMWSDMYIVAPK